MLVLCLQDRWQPMRKDQLSLRTDDCRLPEVIGPRTDKKGPTVLYKFISAIASQIIQINVPASDTQRTGSRCTFWPGWHSQFLLGIIINNILWDRQPYLICILIFQDLCFNLATPISLPQFFELEIEDFEGSVAGRRVVTSDLRRNPVYDR